MTASVHTLAVASHCRVYDHDGRYFAYGPYVKELELWADLFPKVVLASPLTVGAPPGDHLPIARSNVSVAPQPTLGGKTFGAKLCLAAGLPGMIWSLTRTLRKADAVHVRCPGNIGGLAALIAPLFHRKLVAKYAAQWQTFPGEPWSSRLQRRLLSSSWWRGPVTVYGDWPGQSPNVVPFFTSILSADQVRRAARASKRPKFPDGCVCAVFVGRLSKEKNVDVILRAVEKARYAGHDIRLTVVGHGREMDNLQRLSQALGLSGVVSFVGGVAHDKVLEIFERSDVEILVSECEGWPKATAEAMAFGLVAIGSDRGFVPQMLSEGRGLATPAGDVDALAEHLADIAAKPRAYESMRRLAAEWGQRHSLDGLRDAIAELLRRNWNVLIESGHPRASVGPPSRSRWGNAKESRGSQERWNRDGPPPATVREKFGATLRREQDDQRGTRTSLSKSWCEDPSKTRGRGVAAQSCETK